MQKNNIELTKKREKDLLEQLEISPNDLDLLNEIAIFYSENIAIGLSPDFQDIRYFEKAYEIEKTIKSTHNLAFYKAYNTRPGEYSLDELIRIQQECLSLNPKSHLPYELYAYLMLEKSNYEEASKYYQLAIKKGATSFHVFHNLGVVYFSLNNFTRSKEYFEHSLKIAKESDISLYNLAIIYISMGEKTKAVYILKDLENLIVHSKNKCCSEVDLLDLSTLYFSLGDYKKSSALALKNKHTFDFIFYKEATFSLYIENPTIYSKRVENFIAENKETIFEIRNNIEGWEDETDNEKKLALEEARKNIKEYQKMTRDFKTASPKPNLPKEIRTAECECLLFGCMTHGNPENDK